MKILKSFLAFSILLVLFVGVVPEVGAAATDFLENITDEEGTVVDLPTYEGSEAHEGAFGGEGLEGLTSSLYYTVDFMKYIIGGIAVLFILVSAYKLLVAGKSSEEEITKQKTYLIWACVGLILIFMADTIVKEMFFGEEGEILMGDEDQVLEFGYRTNKALQGVYTMLEVFVGAVAVFVIAYEGLRIVAMSYNDEQVTKSKKHVFWSIIALFLIGVSELLVKDIVFPYTPGQGVEVDTSEAKILLASATNFISAIIGFVSVGMLIYGGYLYVIGGASEESAGKAKKVIMGAILGIIMAGAAFAIASTIIPLE